MNFPQFQGFRGLEFGKTSKKKLNQQPNDKIGNRRQGDVYRSKNKY